MWSLDFRHPRQVLNARSHGRRHEERAELRQAKIPESLNKVNSLSKTERKPCVYLLPSYPPCDAASEQINEAERHDCEPNICRDPSDDGKCFRSLEFGKLSPADCDKWGPVFLRRSQHQPSIEERAGVQNGAVLHSCPAVIGLNWSLWTMFSN